MSQLVDTPDGTVEFPDNMSAEQIQTALLNHYQGGAMHTAPGYRPIYSRPGDRLTVDIGGEEQKPVTIDKLGGGPQPAPEAPPAAPTAPQVDRSGVVRGIDASIRGLTKGALGNWDDELTSAINTVIPLDKITNPDIQSVWTAPGNGIIEKLKNAYTKNQSIEHAVEKADEEQNPVIHGVSDIAGTALGAMLGGKLLTKAAPGVIGGLEKMALSAPIRTAAVTGAAGGGVYGGIAGAGEDEGDRIQGLKTGGTIGAMTGTILAPAVATIAPAVARYAKVLFGRGVTNEALQQLVEKLSQDGYDVRTPKGVAALHEAIGQFTGKPVSLADLGSAIRARAGVGLRAPSGVQNQSVDQVVSRAQGQGQRLSQDIYGNVAPRDDVHALEQNLIDQRSAEALPLRDKALFTEGAPQVSTQFNAPTPVPQAKDAGVLRTLGQDVPDTYEASLPTATVATPPRVSRVVDDPQLQQAARLPLAQKALTAALEQAGHERDIAAVTGESIDHLPDLNRGSDLDVRAFDYLKRFLDKEVTALYKRGQSNTFSAAEANNVKDLRNFIRDRMKEVVPHYADYLDSYKGSSDLIDALEEGRGFDKLDPEQLATAQAGRTKGEKELFKVGTARNLLDVVRGSRDGAASANKILNSEEARAQLEAVIGKDATTRLMKSVKSERELNRLVDELRGSQTAQRAAAKEDADGGVQTALPFNPASPISWAGWVARLGLNRASTTRNAHINEALLPRALETNPEIIKRVLIPELERQGKTAEVKALKKQLQGRVVTRTVGGLIGGPLAPPPQEK